jgi:hypothetical protein
MVHPTFFSSTTDNRLTPESSRLKAVTPHATPHVKGSSGLSLLDSPYRLSMRSSIDGDLHFFTELVTNAVYGPDHVFLLIKRIFFYVGFALVFWGP